MIKDQYPLLPVIGPVSYVNHSDMVVDDAGHIFTAFTVGRPDGSVDVVIDRRDHDTGLHSVVHVFDQSTYGKNGYASIVRWRRHLLVTLASRQADGSTVPVIWIILNVAIG